MRESVSNEDFLGRGIFSSGQAKRAIRGNIGFNVFFYKQGKSLSVDRFSFCSKKILTQIQDKNAELRSQTEGIQRSFYGWAKIKAIIARRNRRTVQSTPTEDNPYHADINLPKNLERDEKISHAKELASDSTWVSRFEFNGTK